MPQDPRRMRDVRRQAARRRRRTRFVVAAGVCIAVLVAGAVTAFAWGRTRATADNSVAKAASTTSASPATPTAEVTEPVAAPEATPTVKPTAEVLPEPPSTPKGASKAMSEAAVQFPDAPAVKPVSFGQLKPKHKYVAITLDDGYGFQPEMFELLQQYDARCTTFVLGSWAADNASTLKKLDAAGFEIANHTWDHKTLTKLTDAQIESELLRTQKAISAVTGNQAPYMRPPGGATNTRVKGVVAGLGYKQVMWNRSFGDSGRGATTKKLYENVVTSNGGIKPGDIILCHWGSKATYEAMKKILPELKSQGYEFVTVSELIADSPSKK